MGDEAITVCGDVVIKTGVPEFMRIEVEKTRRACEISKQCHLFRVPEVLDFDESTGTAKFEFLRDIKTLREVIGAGSSVESFMKKLGQGLAVIHRNLRLPDDMRVPLPKDYCLAGTEVFLHGDLGLRNVCVNTNNSQVVILDWRTTVKLCENATYGSRYFDLMWFVYNLFYRPISRARYKASIPAAPMAGTFLRAYFGTTDYGYKHQEFACYMKRFLEMKLSARKKGGHFKRRLLLVPSHTKLRRFIDSFHL
jgi:5-methylthioribose kinase